MTNYSYWKSEYTGKVYRMPADWRPDFDGWINVTEAEYNAYMGRA